MRGKTLRWIECFLRGRTQQVVVEGEQSAPAPVTSGVPQGTVLGPLLFLVYINDLPWSVTSASRLFADDCLIYRVVNNTADSDALQKDLESLQTWEQHWQMSFNPDKCEVIRITNKKATISRSYTIHGEVLKTSNSIKYLGLNIDNKLSWERHVGITSKKATNTLALLRRNISCCPRAIRLTAYKTLIRPQLEYAATVWDNSVKARTTAIEAIQRRAARFITGNYDRRSSVTNMLQELNLEPLKKRRKQAKLTTLFRATHNLIDIPNTYLEPSSRATRGHSRRFLLPSTSVKCYQDSFFPSTISLWNNLPQEIIDAPSIDSFKTALAKL